MCLSEAGKPVLIEAFVPEPPIKALAGRVLCWFSRLDEVMVNALLVAPLIEGLGHYYLCPVRSLNRFFH